MKKLKRGFTLVELLAVIAILAILIIIAVPNVIDIFSGAKKSLLVTQAQSIVRNARMKCLEEKISNSLYNGRTYSNNSLYSLDLNSNDSMKYIVKTDSDCNITYIKILDDQSKIEKRENNITSPDIESADISNVEPLFEKTGTDSSTKFPILRNLTYTTEEFLDITDAIDYSSLISTNGNIYNYNEGDRVLISKKDLGKTTGMQTSSSVQRDYSVAFSGSNNSYGYWYDGTTLKSKYGMSYDSGNTYDLAYIAEPNYSVAFLNTAGNANYSIAYYVEKYANDIGLEGQGRLLTYTEASAMTKSQIACGQNYWLGTAKDSSNVYRVDLYGNMDNDIFYSPGIYGVRPVFVVSKFEIK